MAEETSPGSSYTGICAVCGTQAEFERRHRSLREGFQCPGCRASLRYRGQAEALAELLFPGSRDSLQGLARDGALEGVSLFEPGVSGPFRPILSAASRYVNSFYWPDVTPGTLHEGVRCEDLQELTFEDETFDFVITSDVMEHVRHPWRAFREILRVLKPGGYHVFSIPVQLPMASRSRPRVDTSGSEDVHLEEPHYHGDGAGGRSLVYMDFGWDFLRHLLEAGGSVDVVTPRDDHPEARQLLTFVHRKAGPAGAVAVRGAVCNICGGRDLKAGPLGRQSATGKPPACAGCGSLERHRILRHCWQALPADYLAPRRALQFSRDPSVLASWFSDLEVSVYGTPTSLDIQALDRSDGQYDVLVCNHILEHVEHDEQAFRELMRVVTDEGFVQFTVPSPITRSVTEDWGYAREDFHGHFRHYGMDLVERFGACVPGVRAVRARSIDPCTGVEDYVFFWSRRASTIGELKSWLGQRFEVETYGPF